MAQISFADLDEAVERLGNSAMEWKERALIAEARVRELEYIAETLEKNYREAIRLARGE